MSEDTSEGFADQPRDNERIARLRARVAEWVDIMGFCGRCQQRTEDEPNHTSDCKVGYAHRELRRALDAQRAASSPEKR